MPDNNQISELINAMDPFPDRIIDILLSEEESLYHDFKQTVNTGSEKEWLGLTKDFLAFANTHGGFLLFGIENKTKAKIGLDSEVYSYLSDANNILQKINKYIMPSIINIRIKVVQDCEKFFVIINIPQNASNTHIIEKAGSFKAEDGKTVTILKTGELYVRRPGQTVLATHSDFESLIQRRIQLFRNQIFSNISKVITETSPGKEIYISTEKQKADDGLLYRLSDSPDAIPVAGFPSTIAPRNIEEALAAAIAFNGFYEDFIPEQKILLDFYANRLSARFQPNHYPHLVKFCLISEVPLFYWLIFCDKEPTIELFRMVFDKAKYSLRELILRITCFIDNELFLSFKSRMDSKKLGPEFSEYKKYKGENLMIPHIHLKVDPRFKKIIPIFQDDYAKLSRIATELAEHLRDGNILLPISDN